MNPGLDKPRKEVVVPKEIEHPRRTGRRGRPAGPLLRTDMANRVFHPTEVAYRVFLPPTQLQGFLLVNYKFSPCDGVVCVGLDRIRIRR